MNGRLRRIAVSVLNRVGADSALGHVLIRCAVWARGCSLRIGSDRIEVRRRGVRILMPNSGLILAPQVAADFAYISRAVEPVSGPPGTLDFRELRLFRYRPLGRDMYFHAFPDLIEPDVDYLREFKPQRGDTCFDLGANAGVMSIALAQRVGEEGRVVSVEPDPGNVEALRRNVSIYGQVKVVQAAVSTKLGNAEYVAEGGVTSHLAELDGVTVSREAAGSVISCETVTLQALCDQFGIPAFIKIDIEGMEVAVLRSSAAFLNDHGVALALDTHHPYEGGFTRTAVEQILREVGYRVRSEQLHGCWMTWAMP
jgi:FkbM family methyltransferase